MRRTVMFLATASVILGLTGRPAIADNPPTREQQIAELEKQLAEVQKKLDAARAAARKPITAAEFDTWRSIRGAALSPDGKWFAHRVGPNEGDGEVVLRAADGKETRFPGGGGFGNPLFSLDSKWMAFGATPFSKPGSGPRPKPKFVLVELATGNKTEFDGATSFQFNGIASTHLAYRKATEPSPNPFGAGTPSAGPPAGGSDLVLRDLKAGTDLVLGNVSEFSFDKAGAWLAMVIDAAGQIGNGVQLRDMKSGAVYLIESAKAAYRGLTWNEEFTGLAVLKGVDEPGSDAKWYSLIGFRDVGPSPTRVAYDPKDDKSFPVGMAISPNRPVTWTDNFESLAFGIAERKKKTEPKKEAGPPPTVVPKKDAAAPERKPEEKKEGPRPTGGAKPELVVWHWKDERLQPMQEKQAGADREFAYLALYRAKEKKFLRLADESLKHTMLAPKGKYAIGLDTKPYEYMSYLNGKLFTDVYAIDLKTGEKKKAVGKLLSIFFSPATVFPSPTGTQFLYFHDGHFHVYDMAADKTVNVTLSIAGTTFADTEDDHNIEKLGHTPVGWARDGKSILLSDGWDIWKVAADGSGGTNLTVNGKTDSIRYQGAFQFEPEPKPGTDLAAPFYTTLYGEWTKKSGLGKVDAAKPGVQVLAWGDCRYGLPMKARDAEVFAFTRQTAVDYPDYYLTDGSFKDPKKVTTANPQQASYKWTAGSKLIEYQGIDGKRLQGALFLPADYEPGKRYPTIVYIYEKLSQNLHGYTPPSPMRIGAQYTSNGYAVLMPDITYRLNDPGKSAAECILPALDAAIATGVVDGDRVALHGHSWGGYQTAFMVTQTNRFKCAIAGAALTDLVSMYSSVYWNAGMANQPIFESSQGRFTGPYWDLQEAYLRNSPVYHAKNVTTPLLLLHNDKDGAVDFTQGVEYFNTLRRLGKPVVMLQYKGENHGLAKSENQRDYSARMMEFFDHHLKGKPAPDWWTQGVPYLKMEEHLKGRQP